MYQTRTGGVFDISSGNVVISDPTYPHPQRFKRKKPVSNKSEARPKKSVAEEYGTCPNLMSPAVNGKWHIQYRVSYKKIFLSQLEYIADIDIRHESLIKGKARGISSERLDEDEGWERLGCICVDDGKAGFFDGDKFKNNVDMSVFDSEGIASSESCVLSESGTGNGIYEVFGARNRSGNFVAFRVEYISDRYLYNAIPDIGFTSDSDSDSAEEKSKRSKKKKSKKPTKKESKKPTKKQTKKKVQSSSESQSESTSDSTSGSCSSSASGSGSSSASGSGSSSASGSGSSSASGSSSSDSSGDWN